MPDTGLTSDRGAGKAPRRPDCPSRPWGYGARPIHTSPPQAAFRGLQLIVGAAAGAATYAYYHKVYGYAPPSPPGARRKRQ